MGGLGEVEAWVEEAELVNVAASSSFSPTFSCPDSPLLSFFAFFLLRCLGLFPVFTSITPFASLSKPVWKKRNACRRIIGSERKEQSKLEKY